MNQREHSFLTISRTFRYCYLAFGLLLGVYNIIQNRPYYILLSFASLAFLFLPGLLARILKIPYNAQLEFLILFFSFLAFGIGMVIGGYSNIPYYDKFVHTLSGTFFAWLGLCLFYAVKHTKTIETTDYPMAACFCLFFSLAVAAVWEIYEYLIDLLLKTDPQRVLTTGINDTMQDMIVCLIGALIFEVSVFFYYRRQKSSFLMGILDTLYNKNSGPFQT